LPSNTPWPLPASRHITKTDRILVAQAQVEQLTLLTADDKITAYAVPILWGAP
jgi:PIN domain nuclease of toxin-antitoxin system